MKGETILNALTLAATDPRETETRSRQFTVFYTEVARRLAAYDAAMDARVAERFMSQAMESAVTDFDFFTAVVNRINLDAVKIAELEAKLSSALGLDKP